MSTQITGNSITDVLKKFAKKLSGKEIEGSSTTAVLKDFANKYDGGGGGGDDSFVITISKTGSTFAIDKTYAEIVDAINAGKMPIAKGTWNDGEYTYINVLTFSRYDLVFGTIEFSHFIIDNATEGYAMGHFYIMDDGSASYDKIAIS